LARPCTTAGISATARDIARFGQLLLDDGWRAEQAVIPERWLLSARRLDADIRGAFAASDSESVLPGGWYRNQFWFTPGPSGDIQLCLGIHGQMVFVDPGTRTIAVKFSSWPNEQNHAYLLDTIRAFSAAGRFLASFAPPRRPTRSGLPDLSASPRDANEAVADDSWVPASPRTRGTASRA
jgi:CubicO group peptidase (beta-lactamase class C family)